MCGLRREHCYLVVEEIILSKSYRLTAMFDWEDEEIASIIWGKEGENEDHIVSYPDETYGEHSKVSDQEAATVKLTQKTAVSKNKADSGQGKNTHGRGSTDGFFSLLDLSSSKATKLDHDHIDVNAKVDNGSQIFDNQAEEREGSNFVDYGWANVGSFDDLDRILSNHDLELWSSTKDVNGCLENSELLSINSPSLNIGDLKSNCQHFGTKSGFIKYGKQPNDSGRGKNENPHKEKCAVMKEEPEGQYRQHSKNSSLRMPRDQETDFFGYTGFINALQSPRGYINQHSAGSALPHQQMSSASSYLSDITRDPPLSMTPQEKIEKLRRRQQMRALLAIREKQQEIRQQVDNSNLELSSRESQVQFARADRMEIGQSLSSLLSLDVSSPLEQRDTDTRPMMMDKTSLADSVVHQLQTVIEGLGMQLRLCIRDSLFRLSQGALQRKIDGTNRRSGDEPSTVMEGVSSTKSSARTPVEETNTNPIDRVVARLLFHTLPGQGAKLHCEATATPTMKYLNQNYNDSQFPFLVENKQCLENASNNKKANGSGVETKASSLL